MAMAKAPKRPETPVATARPIEGLIHVIRGQKVMLDSDLAALYEVPDESVEPGRSPQHGPLSRRLYVPAFAR